MDAFSANTKKLLMIITTKILRSAENFRFKSAPLSQRYESTHEAGRLWIAHIFIMDMASLAFSSESLYATHTVTPSAQAKRLHSNMRFVDLITFISCERTVTDAHMITD